MARPVNCVEFLNRLDGTFQNVKHSKVCMRCYFEPDASIQSKHEGLNRCAGHPRWSCNRHRRLTGCTVILCGTTAVGGVDVRGSATGSVELDTLNPGHVAPNVHAIVLAGGSAFGLEASSGVRRMLEKKGIGFNAGVTHVPIVPGAILFDLSIGKAQARPDREMGEKAVEAANDGPVAEGNVGAGTGATVGKILGMKNAMKSGIGSASLTLGSGVMVGALVAVNALGDVIDPKTDEIVAGARKTPGGRSSSIRPR